MLKTARALNQQLSSKLDVKNNLLNHIYEITSMLTRAPDLDREEVLNEIADRVINGLNFDRVIVHLLSKQGTQLECKCIKGFTPLGAERAIEKPLILDRHDCYETRAVRRGEPVFIEDTASHPEFTWIDGVINKYQERKSVLYVPLRLKGKVIGLIGADRFRTRMEMTQDDVESLAIFANQAAIIIENTRLYSALREEKILSENIIRSSVTGVMVSDLNGRIRNLNPKGEEILEIGRDEATRMLIQDLFGFDDKERRRIYSALKRREDIAPFEVSYLRKDGKRLFLGLTAFALVTENQDIQCAVTLIADLTEKKRMDDYLFRVERLAALGWIASGIAHEIRNPLAGIYTTVQNLEGEFDEDCPQRIDLQNILNEINRIEGLIRETLNLARPLPLQIEEVDIHQLLSMTVYLVKKEATQKGIVIKTGFSSETCRTKGDPNRLRQVFLNLIINAVEAIRKKGKIVITTEMMKDKAGTDQWILIRFKDNGAGIPQDQINKIFDPFFTTKSVGTGLGLTVSHKIIQDHQGMLDVESQKSGGTTFSIRLPVFR
jgi:PAS domain S-box-containing protein